MDLTRRILLILFAAGIGVGWICFDERLSRLGDNAEFIDISKGIVTGHGISFVHGPTPEPARKFPPGYPAILAVAQLISPDNVNLMKSVSVLFFALVIPLTWLVVREIDTEISATLVACTALLSPHLIEFSHQVLSEIPYTAISLAGILFLLRNRKSTDPKTLLILICLAVASYYIRTIGLTMIGAVVCTQFLDRRFKTGFVLGVIATLLILPWVVTSSAYLDQFSSVNPYQIETSAIVSAGFLAERVGQNLDKYGFIFFPRAFAPFLDFRSPHSGLAQGLALTIDLLLLYFLVLSIRRSRREAPLGVYLLLYLIIVLLWPEIWADTRFVVPIIPLVAYALFWSVRDLLNRIPIPVPYGRWAPYAFGVIILLAHGTKSATTQIHHAPYSHKWQDYFDSAEWIRDNTPADALIVCRKPFLMNVMSGRKTMAYPWIKPRPLLRSLNTSKVDYVVRDAIFGTTRQILNPAITEYPGSFLPVEIYENSSTVIFEYLGYEEDGNIKKLDVKLAGLNRLIEQDKKNEVTWRTLYALGTMYHQANDLEKARAIYERVLPVLKEQANVSLNLGILHYSEDRFKAAIVAFANAANRDPKDLEARLGLSQAYERVGKFDHAMQQAEAAYQLNNESVEALHAIARSAVALEKTGEAEAAFSQALKLDPKSVAVRTDLAFFYLKNRKYEEARSLLEHLIKDDPERPEYRINLMSALTHLNKTTAAREQLNILLKNHRSAITQGEFRNIAGRILDQLAAKLGTTKEVLMTGTN